MTPSQTDGFLSCPFCEGRAAVRLVPDLSTKAYHVWCLSCHICGPASKTAKEAQAKWESIRLQEAPDA